MQLGDGKARNVTYIQWVEDLEKIGKSYYDFCGFIEGLAVPAVVSPVHDRDTYTAEDVRKWVRRKENQLGVESLYDTETGELLPVWADVVPKVGDKKKAHIHVMFLEKGVRTADFFCERMAEFGLDIGKWRWEKVEHPDAMKRYFAHLDQPDKAEYSMFDVLGFGGVDLSCLVRQDTNSKLKVLYEVQDYVRRHNIRDFHVLADWAHSTRDLDYVNCVSGRASYWVGYFSSKHNADRRAKEKKDKEA